MWICLPQAGLPSIKDEIEAVWLEGRGELTDEQVLWILFRILFKILLRILLRILVGHILMPKFLIRGEGWADRGACFQKSLWYWILFLNKFYSESDSKDWYWILFSWQFLMTIFDDNFRWQFLMTIFDDNFW